MELSRLRRVGFVFTLLAHFPTGGLLYENHIRPVFQFIQQDDDGHLQCQVQQWYQIKFKEGQYNQVAVGATTPPANRSSVTETRVDPYWTRWHILLVRFS